jgi:L-ribulokinase
LGTDAPRLYRALVEATAYGSRAILERFEAQGVQVDSVIAIGGITLERLDELAAAGIERLAVASTVTGAADPAAAAAAIIERWARLRA